MAGTQQHRAGAAIQARQVEDRGFDADIRCPAFQHRHAGRDFLGELAADVLSARVGETCPNLFADGAATPPCPFGLPAANAASSACATGCEGQRMPMLSWPPLTVSAICAARLRISVRGPGQKASISRRASGGTSAAQYDTSPWGAMCTMTG